MAPPERSGESALREIFSVNEDDALRKAVDETLMERPGRRRRSRRQVHQSDRRHLADHLSRAVERCAIGSFAK